MIPTAHTSSKPQTNTRIWYHWFNIRIRQYMIFEIFFFISLFMIFYRLQTLSNQNDRVLEMVSSMERKLETLASQKPSQDIRKFDMTQPLEQSDAQKTKLPTNDSTDKGTPTASKINQLTSQTDNSTVKVQPFRFNAASQKPDEDISKSDKIQSLEQSDGVQQTKLPTQDPMSKMRSPALKMNKSTTKTDNSTLKGSISEGTFRFNAANYLMGASVATHLSSGSSLHSEIQWESNLVLLDRPQPPADKAWCTEDKNPVLTINLAKFIKPISVSYQHSKWNGETPQQAPKTYDVVGCFDDDCKTWETLVLNSQYSKKESNEAEQICNISPNLDMPLIGKVQFRFRENYGHTRRTCVNLVRVYGETETPVKWEKKHLNSEKTCSDLKWYYHNSYFRYYWSDKNCKVLYENECCSDCPECCQECLIYDYNMQTFFHISMFILLIICFVLLICIACYSQSLQNNNL